MNTVNESVQSSHSNGFPQIADYGFISECHSMALVSIGGSIDWCVMPRIDANSVFGRILDRQRGGHCKLCPDLEEDKYERSRRYLDGTLILETTFKTDGGQARLYDCFAMKTGGRIHPLNQLIRIVEGVEGEVPMKAELAPRFDYGLLRPWMRRCNDDKVITAIGGHQGLLFSGDITFDDIGNSGCRGSFTIAEGQRRYLAIAYRLPHELDLNKVEIIDTEEIERRFQDTIKWWRNWCSQMSYDGANKKQVLTSAMVLKGLTNAPTGAIAAAATTSLPERIGGSRNWDYRYSWVRDSVFTVSSLAKLGFRKEADGFRRFIERTAAGEASELQVMFGVGGEHYLPEHEISDLEGYRGSAPVRVGNAAANQMQHDVFGEILHLTYRWYLQGNSPDDQYWDFIIQLVDRTRKMWRSPDHGIWEIRGEPRHYVHSKAMCWAAFDRAIHLARETGREGPLQQWEKERDEIRKLIEERGFDRERGVYTQAFGYPYMDASLLLLPIFNFIAFDDGRMIRTTDLIREELHRDGLIMRYPEGVDGLDGREGTFGCCTFWLAEVLARQNRLDDARESFAAGCKTANDLGLFSEEFDAGERIMLGNFPQGLSHLSMISAAVAINEEAEKK